MRLRLLALCFCVASSSAELPNGLVFHLDASALKEARSAAGLPSIGNSQPADFVVETASRSVTFQPSPEHRPVYISDGEAAYLKFDGKDDFLLWNIPSRTLSAMTVFVVAAPRTNAGNFSGLFATTE